MVALRSFSVLLLTELLVKRVLSAYRHHVFSQLTEVIL